MPRSKHDPREAKEPEATEAKMPAAKMHNMMDDDIEIISIESNLINTISTNNIDFLCFTSRTVAGRLTPIKYEI